MQESRSAFRPIAAGIVFIVILGIVLKHSGLL